MRQALVDGPGTGLIDLLHLRQLFFREPRELLRAVILQAPGPNLLLDGFPHRVAARAEGPRDQAVLLTETVAAGVEAAGTFGNGADVGRAGEDVARVHFGTQSEEGFHAAPFELGGAGIIEEAPDS